MSRRLYDLFCSGCGAEHTDRWEEYDELNAGRVPCNLCEHPLSIKIRGIPFNFANGWTSHGEPKYIEAQLPGSDKWHKLDTTYMPNRTLENDKDK